MSDVPHYGESRIAQTCNFWDSTKTPTHAYDKRTEKCQQEGHYMSGYNFPLVAKELTDHHFNRCNQNLQITIPAVEYFDLQ